VSDEAASVRPSVTAQSFGMPCLKTIMHGLPADVPVMVCEDVHAMLMKGALLRCDVNDLSQKQFTAGSELIVWPGECLPSHRTLRMSTVLLCCVFCILMLSVLVQAVPCAGL